MLIVFIRVFGVLQYSLQASLPHAYITHAGNNAIGVEVPDALHIVVVAGFRPLLVTPQRFVYQRMPAHTFGAYDNNGRFAFLEQQVLKRGDFVITEIGPVEFRGVARIEFLRRFFQLSRAIEITNGAQSRKQISRIVAIKLKGQILYANSNRNTGNPFFFLRMKSFRLKIGALLVANGRKYFLDRFVHLYLFRYIGVDNKHITPQSRQAGELQFLKAKKSSCILSGYLFTAYGTRNEKLRLLNGGVKHEPQQQFGIVFLQNEPFEGLSDFFAKLRHGLLILPVDDEGVGEEQGSD